MVHDPWGCGKKYYTQIKHFCTFFPVSSKASPVMTVHAPSWAPWSSWRGSWASLPRCWQARATQRSCLLPGDREGQRRAPVATRHTCTRQFGSGPLCDGCKSVYELQSGPVKHIILPGLPLLQKRCALGNTVRKLFLRLSACKAKLPI